MQGVRACNEPGGSFRKFEFGLVSNKGLVFFGLGFQLTIFLSNRTSPRLLFLEFSLIHHVPPLQTYRAFIQFSKTLDM